MVDNSKIRVAVGVSGGTDSSVSALLLKQQGSGVVSAFMKNWDDTDDSRVCTATGGYEGIKKVADEINTPYYSINFERDYWERAFEYFLNEYKKDKTPNPDVMCNKEIKPEPLLDFAMDLGADYIAVGHYAIAKVDEDGIVHMMRPKDSNKDQAYSLSQLSQNQLKKVIFPLTNLAKPQVREVTTTAGLVTAKKKDSTRICFIGERNFRRFLSEFLLAQSGKMVAPDRKVAGEHAGLMYYTIDQRSGLGLGSTKESANPWSAIGKNLKKNGSIVGREHGSKLLYTISLDASGISFFTGSPDHNIDLRCIAKFRYHQPDVGVAMYYHAKDNTIHAEFDEPARAVTPRQAIVPYNGEECLGGTTINRAYQNEKQLQLV